MTPSEIVDSLRSQRKGAADILADWLIDHNFAWQFPMPDNAPSEGDCIAWCRWCRTPVSYPQTMAMIRAHTRWTCTSCTPVPPPRLLINEMMSRMDLKMQIQVSSRSNGEEYDMLRCVLEQIEEIA